ncbi:hypothetical protein [Streptomyces tamarix]|uniref:hypothetical protein n=1 Tax=Streptomyces tamarix TaxID=3078565 RepID=UPI0037039EDE
MAIRHHRAAALTAASVLAPALLAGPAATAGPAAADDRRERAGASCRTEVEGSRATAYCHNPYPRTDRVRLHVECARWWDVDADSAPVEVRATAYVELTARCWKEVRAAWISHDPLPGPGS